CAHYRHWVTLHFADEDPHMGILQVGSPEQFIEDRFQLLRSQARCLDGIQQGQRDFSTRGDANGSVQFGSLEHSNFEQVIWTDLVLVSMNLSCSRVQRLAHLFDALVVLLWGLPLKRRRA